MVELDDSLGDHEGVVVGQRHDARTELDAVCALGGGGEEHFGGGYYLPAGGVVFAAPEFVVAKPVHEFDQFKVALQLQGGVFANRVVWREECAEFQVCQVISPVRVVVNCESNPIRTGF